MCDENFLCVMKIFCGVWLVGRVDVTVAAVYIYIYSDTIYILCVCGVSDCHGPTDRSYRPRGGVKIFLSAMKIFLSAMKIFFGGVKIFFIGRDENIFCACEKFFERVPGA